MGTFKVPKEKKYKSRTLLNKIFLQEWGQNIFSNEGKLENFALKEKGEGFSGTCIKDTWTKPRGVGLRVRGGDD